MTQLVKKIVSEVSQASPELGQWIEDSLEEAGPWSYKTDDKARVNCFMRYHLSQALEDTRDVREYLSDVDPDDAWINAIVNKVAPVLVRHH